MPAASILPPETLQDVTIDSSEPDLDSRSAFTSTARIQPCVRLGCDRDLLSHKYMQIHMPQELF